MTSPKIDEKSFFSYFETGKSFSQAFNVLWNHNERSNLLDFQKERNILPMAFLLGHSLECYFKAYLTLCGIANIRKIKDKTGKPVNGHDLAFLYRTAQKEHKLYLIDDIQKEIHKKYSHDRNNEEAFTEYMREKYKNNRIEVFKLVEELNYIHGPESEFSDRYLHLGTRMPAHYVTKIFDRLRFLERRITKKYTAVTRKEYDNVKVKYSLCQK